MEPPRRIPGPPVPRPPLSVRTDDNAPETLAPSKDTDEWWGDAGCVLFLVVIIAGAIGAIGWEFGVNQERRKAKAAGVGRYVADPQSGAVSFEYSKKE